MTKHYESGELLAHAYQLDDDPELARHLGGCHDCGRRLAALREGLDRHAAKGSEFERPETFWKRQELSVMREIDKRRRRMPGVPAQLAAAAALLFVVAAFVAGRGSVAPSPAVPTALTATMASTTTAAASSTQENGFTTNQITTDPWESEQLQDFQTVVDWETWVEADEKKRGTI